MYDTGPILSLLFEVRVALVILSANSGHMM